MKVRLVEEVLVVLVLCLWTNADFLDGGRPPDGTGARPRGGEQPRGEGPPRGQARGGRGLGYLGDSGYRTRYLLQCSDQLLTDPRGRIASPGYPGPIPANTCFKWYIHVQQGETLTVTFRDFNVSKRPDKSCSQGYLELGSQPHRHVCLNSLNDKDNTIQGEQGVYESTESITWLKLVTGPQGSDSGFVLEYIFDKVPRLSCEPGLKLCGNGKCLPVEWFCNGVQECGVTDSTDESRCSVPEIPVPDEPAPLTPDAGCGKGRFMCVSRIDQELTCFEEYQRCDGIVHCQGAEDERRCETRTMHCGGFTELQSGYITSPNYPKSYPPDKTCAWNIHVPAGKIIQVRFQNFILSPENPMTGTSDYVEFRDGRGRRAKLLGRYTAQRRPPSVIESTTDWLYVKFKSDIVGQRDDIGFNFTHQIKGVCLSGQEKCSDEEDCFNGRTEKCDGIWHCRRHGWDERGCANCESDKYSCGSGGKCYTEEEHCNGRGSCFDNRDEKNCTPEQCNSGNGTYLCQNSRCIYESWVCDGTNDCDDDSDERDCVETPSIRVILAAVVGSLICGLLLVIALGCTLHMFAIRIQDQSSHFETPMSRIQAELMRRAAPPSYNEAMQTSVPFTEMLTHMRAAGRRLSRGWRAPEITPGAPLNVAPLIANPLGTRIPYTTPLVHSPPGLTDDVTESGGTVDGEAVIGEAAAEEAETAGEDATGLLARPGFDETPNHHSDHNYVAMETSGDHTETSLCAETGSRASSNSDVSLLEVTSDQSQPSTDDQALLLANVVRA